MPAAPNTRGGVTDEDGAGEGARKWGRHGEIIAERAVAKGSVIGPVGDGAKFVPGTRDATGPIFPGAKPRAKGKGKSEAGLASTPTGPARPDEAPMDPAGNYENDDGTFSTVYE